MAAPAPDRQQQLRRRHQHERQAVVFGTLVAAMALAGLGAAAVYSNALDVPFLDRAFSTPPPEASDEPAPPPCPPEGTLPVAYAQIQVQVLNGAGQQGLAGTVATDLTNRGFGVSGAGNYPASYAGVAQISFGQSGLASAYTLAAHVDGAVLVLDQRADAGVDIVLGQSFTTLLDPTTVVLDPAAPLVGPAGCVPLDEAIVDAAPAPTAPGTEAPVEPAPEG